MPASELRHLVDADLHDQDHLRIGDPDVHVEVVEGRRHTVAVAAAGDVLADHRIS